MAGPVQDRTAGFAPRPARRVKGGAARLLVLLAGLFALAWQSVLAEAHGHRQGPAQAAAFAAGTAPPLAWPGQPGDTPTHCPICRELGHSLAYVPPAPPALPGPAPREEAAPPPAPGLPPPAEHRGHHWRSRAPPLSDF